MAQRRSAAARTKAKTKPKAAGKKVKAAKPVVTRAKTKAKSKAKAAKSKSAAKSKTGPKPKAAPKRAVAKAAKPSTRKAVKPASAKAAKAPAVGEAQNRRQRPGKGRRAPASERTPVPGAEIRGDDYVYERDTRDAVQDGEANDTYTPGNLAPGQVGEARPARSDGRRGSRGISARLRESETESVTADGPAAAPAHVEGGFEEGADRLRGAEIAGTQRTDGADKSDTKQDYGRPKAGGAKSDE